MRFSGRFQMPAFTVGLCKSPKEVIEKLPPTDTRWRKDTRLVELGKWKEVCIPFRHWLSSSAQVCEPHRDKSSEKSLE